MADAADLQNQWEALLKILQIREPKLFNHLKGARPKELKKYNLVLVAQNAEAQKEMEVGLKVYSDKIEGFTGMIFGEGKGIKVEAAPSPQDWEAMAPAGSFPVSGDQSELLKVLEASIRQKLEAELRSQIQGEGGGSNQGQLLQQLKEDLQEEEQNRRLAVRMTLMADGDKSMSQLMMAWQQAKQTGDGGPPWNEVKQHLLELLDTTVQLIQS